jgi:hypothetical protein
MRWGLVAFQAEDIQIGFVNYQESRITWTIRSSAQWQQS